MKQLNAIEKEFRSRARMPGSVLMLRPADAIEMVQKCRQSKVPVVGIDGFVLHQPQGTEPTIDTIDLSDASLDAESKNNCWDLAESFLKNRLQKDLWFEVCMPR
jgi:hypothetical protein